MDKFYEQLLGTTISSTYKLLNILMYVLVIIGVLLFVLATLTFNFKVFALVLLVFAGAYLVMILRDKQYSEYEYIFTNGNLQIDVIYNQKRRKTLLDLDVKEFESFGKEGDIKIPQGAQIDVYIPWDYKEDRYVFLYNGGKRAAFISPNEEMLKLINLYFRGKRV